MNNKDMRVLVLGASGMLGNAVMRFFAKSKGFDVVGSVRSFSVKPNVPFSFAEKMIVGHDLMNHDHLMDLYIRARPNIVINCVGLVKQLHQANDPLEAIPINGLLPHRLVRLCDLSKSRLIHISTDCVFSGSKGSYRESDLPDAIDLYGRTKLLGEVDSPNAITLRTSIIGHELHGSRSLINWFLSQEGKVKGYTKAIFSGLPTVEVARIIRDFVVPNTRLRGLYHLSAQPISKYELLKTVASVYEKSIILVPDESVVIDRSLDSSLFRSETGYNPEQWPELIRRMHQFQ